MGFKKTVVFSAALLFMLAIMLNPEAATQGAIKGLYLCGNIIIPSLFPFCICVYMLIRCKLRAFSNCYAVFVLSLIGGYPIGAALTEELYNEGLITKKGTELMHCCCVNGGPAFIIIAIGSNLLADKSLGIALFICHILPSVLFMMLLFPRIKSEAVLRAKVAATPVSIKALFTCCVRDAAGSVISICSYVILFSCITQLMNANAFLSAVSCLLEVTSAVGKLKNIYIIAFLLGFSGISIWLQIFAVAEKSGINIGSFIPARVLHGLLSALLLRAYVALAKPEISVFSNIKYSPVFAFSATKTAVCTLMLGAILILSLENKNNCGK